MNVERDVKAGMNLFKMLMGLGIYIHFFACLWWFMIKENKHWIPWRHIGSDDEKQVYYYSIPSQYLVCLHVSVQTLLGIEQMPIDKEQIAVIAIGVLLGAIINANIFGELSMIYHSLGREEKLFQEQFTSIKTTMKNLKLPEKVNRRVRDYTIINQPSYQLQQEMKEFQGFLSPSLKIKVNHYIYKQVVKKVEMFRNEPELQQFIVSNLKLSYQVPEAFVIKQGDKNNKHLYLTGAGIYEVSKLIDGKVDLKLGCITENKIIGEVFVIFGRIPDVTISCMSYCTLA